MGNGNIAISDKWGILQIPTSPQMRINIPILQVKIKYFDLFLIYWPEKKILCSWWVEKKISFATVVYQHGMEKISFTMVVYHHGKEKISFATVVGLA